MSNLAWVKILEKRCMLLGTYQVIGRFVQNQEVGGCKHHAAKRQTRLFSPAQELYFLFDGISLEQDLAEEGS